MDRNIGLYTACEHGDFKEFWTALQPLMKQKENPTVEEDEDFGGHRVIFTQAEEILQRRYVSRFPVYPLVSTLVVHTDMHKFEDDFKQLLEDAMEEFGLVLEVSRLLFDENIPNAYTKNWKVVLGVPEKSDLAPFRRMGLPDMGLLKLPGYQQEFKVTFCCSACSGKSRYSHTAWNCLTRPTPAKTETQSSKIDSIAASSIRETKAPTFPSVTNKTIRMNDNFRIRDRREEGKPMKRGFDTIAREIGEEQVRSAFGEVSESGPSKRPKTEMEDDEESRDGSHQQMMRRMMNDSLNESSMSNSISNQASDTDNDIMVIDHAGTSTRVESRLNSTEEVPSSSLPDHQPVKPELPSTDEEVSNQETPSPRPILKPRRTPNPDLTVRIPDAIRQIIRQQRGVLDDARMEAFFNHVKKKASPCEVASRYTEDVGGLKAQLQDIRDRYYNLPMVLGAEDKRFMKWFESMLARFDQVPCVRPRKKATKK